MYIHNYKKTKMSWVQHAREGSASQTSHIRVLLSEQKQQTILVQCDFWSLPILGGLILQKKDTGPLFCRRIAVQPSLFNVLSSQKMLQIFMLWRFVTFSEKKQNSRSSPPGSYARVRIFFIFFKKSEVILDYSKNTRLYLLWINFVGNSLVV